MLSDAAAAWAGCPAGTVAAAHNANATKILFMESSDGQGGDQKRGSQQLPKQAARPVAHGAGAAG
ncbi:hypothetical protein GCM10020220_064050 [Nonomuraea rubra]